MQSIFYFLLFLIALCVLFAVLTGKESDDMRPLFSKEEDNFPPLANDSEVSCKGN